VLSRPHGGPSPDLLIYLRVFGRSHPMPDEDLMLLSVHEAMTAALSKTRPELPNSIREETANFV
jgi:hypothetical protein